MKAHQVQVQVEDDASAKKKLEKGNELFFETLARARENVARAPKNVAHALQNFVMTPLCFRILSVFLVRREFVARFFFRFEMSLKRFFSAILTD